MPKTSSQHSLGVGQGPLMRFRTRSCSRSANRLTPCDPPAILIVPAAVAPLPKFDESAAPPPVVRVFGPTRLQSRSSAESFGLAPAPDRLRRDGREVPVCGVAHTRHGVNVQSMWQPHPARGFGTDCLRVQSTLGVVLANWRLVPVEPHSVFVASPQLLFERDWLVEAPG